MPYEPPSDMSGLSLAEIGVLVAQRKLPPVSEWHPTETGESHMRICADGTWLHEGEPISRPAMVRAFSSLLMRDNQRQHWLVTPSQKLSIDVEDSAFVAVDIKQEGDALALRLNTDEFVVVDADHPIISRGDTDTPALYVGVRHGTEARLNRSTYMQIFELSSENSGWTINSCGEKFALIPHD